MVDYSLFDKVILKFVPWIREQISKSPDNIIRIKVIDIKKEIPELREKTDTELYWGLKFVLYKYGIDLTLGKTSKDEPIFSLISIKDVTLPQEIIKLKVDTKIPIVSPIEISSGDKRFLVAIIKQIEELELPITQNIIVFNIMIAGAKFAIDQNIEVEDLLTYYHTDNKSYYFFGITDALEKYDEITDFIKTYSTSEDEFKLYFGLYSSGISLMSDTFEKEPVSYMKKIIEDIDSLIKEDEAADPKFIWEEVKDYIAKME